MGRREKRESPLISQPSCFSLLWMCKTIKALSLSIRFTTFANIAAKKHLLRLLGWDGDDSNINF
jgi:hypothetical protein